MNSEPVVYGRDKFFKGKSKGETRRIQVQLDSLIKYLTSEYINYQNGVFNLASPVTPNCPECSSCTELLAGHAGDRNDLTYFVRCDGKPPHLFILRIVKSA